MPSENAKPFQKALLLVSLFLTACGGGGNTTTCNIAAPTLATQAPVVTSTGTDFYLTLPDHLCSTSPGACKIQPSAVSNKLIVTSATATTGEMIFNGVATPFSVAAGGEVVILLDPAVVLDTNEMIEARGIHVTSLSPVSVHVVAESPYSADGYLALPTAGLGTDYYVMSYASNGQPGSEFALVATQDNTFVTITPTATGPLNKPVNVAFTILLNRGETYQYANPAFADLTGTRITADKQIAVFSGHRFANLPSSTGWGDYLVEQIPDTSAWGRTHHTTPFSGRARYTVRVLASQDNTTFTTIPTDKSGIIGTLNAGQFADIDMTGAGEFVSNNPVLVAQFMRGYADDTAAKGDPSMVIITPAEQGITDATFSVHGLAGTAWAYINIVTETAALANLTLDNLAVNSNVFTPIDAASLYSMGTIQVKPGVHTLQGSVPFSAFVYDYGIARDAVSYIYPVAATLSVAAPVAQVLAPASPSPSACVNNLVTASGQSPEESESDETAHDDTEGKDARHEDHARTDHHDHHDDDHGQDQEA